MKSTNADHVPRAVPAWAAALLLLLLCGALFGQHIVYFHEHAVSLQGTNAGDYLLQSAVLAFRFTGHPSQHFAPLALTAVSYKPPLFATAAGGLAALGGLSLPVFNLTATLFLILAVLAAYFIGARLWGRPWGLIASFLLACLPMVVNQSLTHTPEIAQMALVTLTVALLLPRRRFWSAAAGAAGGLAMLSRGTAAIYLVAPLAVVVVGHVRRDWNRHGRRGALLRLGLFLAGLLVVAGPWYLPRLGKLSQDFAFHVTDFTRQYQTGHTERGQFFLTAMATANALPFFVLFLAGWSAAVIRRRPGLVLLSAWYLAPFLLFTIAPADITRFMIPTYPVMALAIAAGLSACRPRVLAVGLTALTLLFGFTQRFVLLTHWQPQAPIDAAGQSRGLLALATEPSQWPELPPALEAMADRLPDEPLGWVGFLEMEEEAGPPLSLVKVLLAIRQPLKGTIALQQHVATPLALRQFFQALPYLEGVIALTPPGAAGWPTTEQLRQVVAPRGMLQQKDYRIDAEPLLEIMKGAGAFHRETERRHVAQPFSAGFDLVLLQAEATKEQWKELSRPLSPY